MLKEININLSEYSYHLPDEKIAFEGTKERDTSKLLFYKNESIKDLKFKEITEVIPDGSTLFFNDTKVIPARIIMSRKTGAFIEIFLLKPAYNKDIAQSLESFQNATWECMVGNLKKWKEDEVLSIELVIDAKSFLLHAKLVSKIEQTVEFSWNNNDISFAQVLELLGKTPLPPYIKREANPEDKERYQTVYSKIEGAVAAPTAGLHFTDAILNQLRLKGIEESFFTLHVGAGTFMPIKAETVDEHPMHNETMIIPIEAVESTLTSNFTIAVGTTSMRTLESLYWFGVKLMEDSNASFHIDKLYAYEVRNTLPTRKEAMVAVLHFAKQNNLNHLKGSTEIFIFPGYQFKMCDGLITNFHQPGSTLILLVAAFIGNSWKKVYEHALSNNYRFLSFGDSSILLP